MTTTTLNSLIWQIVAAIPEGKVMTYGKVAQQAGYPSHSRYVGSTLKNLPKDTRLPWHRVINSQGKISFPENSDGYLRQKERLEKEGIIFTGGKIRLKDYLLI